MLEWREYSPEYLEMDAGGIHVQNLKPLPGFHSENRLMVNWSCRSMAERELGPQHVAKSSTYGAHDGAKTPSP
jgi:hypothetical protein